MNTKELDRAMVEAAAQWMTCEVQLATPDRDHCQGTGEVQAMVNCVRILIDTPHAGVFASPAQARAFAQEIMRAADRTEVALCLAREAAGRD